MFVKENPDRKKKKKLIDKEQNNTFQTTLYRKPTDQISMINNLHEHSDHPQSTLKNQKIISPTLLEYEKH